MDTSLDTARPVTILAEISDTMIESTNWAFKMILVEIRGDRKLVPKLPRILSPPLWIGVMTCVVFLKTIKVYKL